MKAYRILHETTHIFGGCLSIWDNSKSWVWCYIERTVNVRERQLILWGKIYCLGFCYVDDSGEVYRTLKRIFLYQWCDRALGRCTGQVLNQNTGCQPTCYLKRYIRSVPVGRRPSAHMRGILHVDVTGERWLHLLGTWVVLIWLQCLNGEGVPVLGLCPWPLCAWGGAEWITWVSSGQRAHSCVHSA